MSDVTNSISNQIYNIREGENLDLQVVRVIFVMMPRAIMAAGFDSNGTLLTVRSSDHADSDSQWILDFYEHHFLHDPLLVNAKRVVAAFIVNEYSMVVPSALYDEQTATSWLRNMHFIESSEAILNVPIQQHNAYYVSSWPGTIKSLIWRYYPARKIFPVAYYQFNNNVSADQPLAECCISKNHVAVTLYREGKLLWHQVFDYATAEDIAYHIGLSLKLHHIDKDNVILQTTTTAPGMAEIVNNLTQYYPNLRDGHEGRTEYNGGWNGTLSLLQQLYECAL